MPKQTRILIVGAGLAGLSLAIDLRRRGFQPDIIEKQAHWPQQGAGIYLLGNAMRALAKLGVAQEIQAQGSLIETQSLRNHRGKGLVDIDLPEHWESCGPCVGIRRAVLQDILVHALSHSDDSASVSHVQFDTTLASLHQDGQKVSVTLSSGQQAEYDWVIGADGIRSSLRSLAFPPVATEFCGQVCWRFLVPCPSTITGWTTFLGKAGAFLFIPVGAGLAYCYADRVVETAIDDPLEGRLERLRQLFADYAAPVTQALAAITDDESVHFAAIEQLWQEPWVQGKLILIGDAAHACSPNMASGAAMAFEDALILSKLLFHSLEHADPGAFVRTAFPERRQDRVRWVQQQTLQRDKMRKMAPWLRDIVLQLFGKRAYYANYRPLLEKI